MGLFSRNPQYPPGVVPVRRFGFRQILLILGVLFGLYFLNLAFLWVKIPSVPVLTLRHFNIAAGVLFIILGIMTMIRRKY